MTRRTYDVIVVGAGSVGVPAAWAMARSGLRVLVVEQKPSPGQGSNKTAIGGMRATHSEPAKIKLCLRSLEIASTWREVYGDPINWSSGGYTFVAYRKQEESTLKGLLSSQQTHGLDIEWNDREQLLERIPDLSPDGLRGGTFSPGDGQCSPLLLGHSMYRQAERAGAQFLFGAELTGIDLIGSHVRGIRTSVGRMETPILLNAAGAWAAEVGRMVGLSHDVIPDAHEAGITEPVAPFLSPMVVDIKPSDGAANGYFFQLATGQILFALTPSPLVPGFDCRETSGFLPIIARRLIRLVPRLSGLRVRRTWRGLYPMTPDGAPLVGWSEEIQGYLMAIGMCGHGFMLGPGLGELLERLVHDRLTDDDRLVLEGLSPTRTFEGDAVLE